MSLVYNLVWYSPLQAPHRRLDVCRVSNNCIVVIDYIEAVILFPTLMTPLVLHRSEADPWLELLIATKETLTEEHVNLQLKINSELPADKQLHGTALFTGWHGNIEVAAADQNGDGIVRTHERFEGVIHDSFETTLKNSGYTKYWRVRVHVEALDNAEECEAALRPATHHGDRQWRAETHDQLIKATLERLHSYGGYRPLPQRGLFAFRVDDSGPTSELETDNPILAFHPVYMFMKDEPQYLNFGHLTDIHINNRLNILKANPARVIEGADDDVSPPVGQLLQTTNRSFQALLDEMAFDTGANALLIGGDLIDHHINAWSEAPVNNDMNAVWDAVDMSSGLQKQRYRPGVDMVGFYSQLHRFCSEASKPVFGIAGNHDAYLAPFGISPRVLGNRANAGIPADLNLTIYEALLAFGSTFGHADLPSSVSNPPSSFRKEWMEWFYTVFTPFVEASVRLPKQRIVCLGWGDDEDMFFGGQGTPSHLPRADNAVSDVQMKLLQNASAHSATHSVIVLSHFTVASFREDVPLRTERANAHAAAQPTVGHLETVGDEAEFNMGTFETNHQAFLKLLAERKVTCVFSGHSHRRGLYFLGSARQDASSGHASYPVTIYDPEHFDFSRSESHNKPALIVSDSAGPYPRYNLEGEFDGWGSDLPAGSVVSFDAHGALKRVRVVRAKGAKPPRLAVALDYADIDKNIVWSQPIHIDWMLVDSEIKMFSSGYGFSGELYRICVPLHQNMRRDGLRVRKISFMRSYAPPSLVVMVRGQSEVVLHGRDNFLLFQWMKQTKAPDKFIAIEFEWAGNPSIVSRYDRDSPWIFEVEVTRTEMDGVCKYEVARPLRWEGMARYPELPDFSWRRSAASRAAQPPASGMPSTRATSSSRT